MFTIRSIAENDAVQFLDLRKQLYVETSYLLMEPGEDLSTVDDQRDRILRAMNGDEESIYVAEREGALIGFAGARRGQRRRNRHTASIVMGVLQAYIGKGVGKALLSASEHWARNIRLRRLELTVMVHNDRAIRLYRRAGFLLEGTKRESLIVENRATDEHLMAKLLSYDEHPDRAASQPSQNGPMALGS